jgi:RNA polymerase sigma-70 factor (ECF subfamily)
MIENQFDEIVDRYSQPIWSIIFKMVHHKETAYDLTQDVFTKVWEHRNKFDHQKQIFTYIYKIAMNLSIDYLRKNKPDIIETELLELINSSDPDDQDELFNLIVQCSSDLKPKQKAVFLLRDIEGFTYKEIAETLKMSVNNIQSDLHLARKKIRHLLESKYQLTLETLYDM